MWTTRPVDLFVFIADTNIVSEFMKDTPEQRVLAWAQSLGAADLTVSVVSVEEIDRWPRWQRVPGSILRSARRLLRRLPKEKQQGLRPRERPDRRQPFDHPLP